MGGCVRVCVWGGGGKLYSSHQLAVLTEVVHVQGVTKSTADAGACSGRACVRVCVLCVCVREGGGGWVSDHFWW